MLVEVGEALRVGRAVHRDHQTLAPAQVQQALGVVGVVMGLEDAIETMGREALAEIDQAAVDQPALAGALQQRATGTATQAGVGAGVATGRAIATVDRHLAGVAGAEQGQAHARSLPRRARRVRSVSSRSPELSSWNSGPSRPAANSALRARRASISSGLSGRAPAGAGAAPRVSPRAGPRADPDSAGGPAPGSRASRSPARRSPAPATRRSALGCHSKGRWRASSWRTPRPASRVSNCAGVTAWASSPPLPRSA